MKLPESTKLVSKLSLVGSVCVPLATVFVVYRSLTINYQFPDWIAIPIALGTEALGFTFSILTLANRTHNRKNPQDASAWNVFIPGVAFLAYIAVAIVLTAIMGHDPVLGIFPVLSLLAAIAVGLWEDYDARMGMAKQETEQTVELAKVERKSQAEIELEKIRQQAERQARIDAQNFELKKAEIEAGAQVKIARIEAKSANGVPLAQNGTNGMPRGTYDDYKAAQVAQTDGKRLGADEIQELFGVPRRTAYNWMSKYNQNGNGNGHN
jgi:hypothetical protein